MTDTSRLKLTAASVKQRCAPAETGKPAFYWDTELRGFGVKVTPHSKTFVLQKDVNGRSKRVTIGRFGEWTVDEARKYARELVVQMVKGIDPNEEKRSSREKGVTLDEAIEMHLAAMRAKKCAPRSMATIREECERHLSDWLRRPLSSVTRNECATRHERITERNGRYAANRALQHFRTVYNTANRRMEGLPPNPVIGVTFNKVKRRREPISWADLPAWKARVDGIQNPIRRDLQLFLLFTGLRSLDARTVQWRHVNLGDTPRMVDGVGIPPGCIRRPKPKGGEDRAFTVPVSGAVLELLRRRQEENHRLYPNDGGWVFPSTDREGRVVHVAQAKEQRYDDLGRKVGFLPSPHRLRDTFASAAHVARVHPLDLKILMNHTLAAGDDVTEGYIRPSVEHLRGCAEQIAAFLLGRMGRGECQFDAVDRSAAG